MATVNVVSRTHTMDANDTYVLRWAHNNAHAGIPYTIIAEIVDNGSDDGSYTVAARPAGSTSSFRQIPVQSLHLNNAVGTGALVSTAITNHSLIAVEADGLEVAIVRAGGTAGSSALTLAVSSMI
jgi:hypothetical protein